MKNIAKQSGLTLLEVAAVIAALAALLAVLVALVNETSDNARRTACLTSMDNVINMNTVWASTITPQSPNGDNILCDAAKTAVDAWNVQCDKVMTSLPGPKACS